MKANALGLIESLGNLFAEWKTVREALNCLCVWFCGVYLSSHWALARMCFGFCHSPAKKSRKYLETNETQRSKT